MAMHHELSIHKQAYQLLSVATDLTRNIPRDLKAGLGAAVRDECVALLVLIARANAARDKTPYLERLIERNDVLSTLLRLLKEKRFISINQHAEAMALTISIGKQATGWRKSCRIPA